MSRILCKTTVIMDEEYLSEERICRLIEKWLDETPLDTYNHTYVVQVTIDEVDDDLS